MWEAIKDAVFACIEFFHGFVGDWGLAIIVVTLIFRILLFPLMQKQIKSSYQMQKFSPKMRAIQEKYADNKQRMSEEMQKMYAESGFNPLAGCLPILLQMPIFLALFQTLLDLQNHGDGANYSFYNILPSLLDSPATMWATGPVEFAPYGILLLLFAFATFLPTVLQQRGSDNPQKNQTMIMVAIMSIIMLFVGWNSPAGVLLFWATTSVFAVAQQTITMSILKREDKLAEEAVIDTKPVEVDVVRKVKKPRPTKKSK